MTRATLVIRSSTPIAGATDPLGEPRFEFQGLLGRGGMGTVHRVYDHQRQMVVAVKLLEHATPDGLFRFKREFRAIAGVSHPNLLSLYELLSSGDRWFFTMELVEGQSLTSWVRGTIEGASPASQSPLPGADADGTLDLASGSRVRPAATPTGTPTGETTSVTIVSGRAPSGAPHGRSYSYAPVVSGPELARLRVAFRQLAQALSALHAAGHLHRDVKPSNVLVDGNGRVVLLDFGIATSLADDRSLRGRVAGTPAFMAPEQAHEGPLDEACDWYAFGVMLYELLAGRRPHAGGTDTMLASKAAVEVISPVAFAPDAPPDLVGLCEALLRREPCERPRGEEILRRLGGGRDESASQGSLGEDVPMVGRASELAELERHLAEAERGQLVVLQLRGSSGAGKSVLLGHFTRQVRARGGLVLAGRSYQRESLPFKSLDALLDGLPLICCGGGVDDPALLDALAPAAAQLAGIFPVLRTLEDERRARGAPEQAAIVQPPDPTERRRLLVPALRRLLDEAAQKRPLVLVLDDVQWGDGDSAALIAQALASPWSSPVLLILASRAEEERGEFVRTFTRWSGEQHLLDVGPLEPAAAEQLACQLLAQVGGDVREAAALARESAGIPLFIAEMARQVGPHPQAVLGPGDRHEGGAGAFVRALRHRFLALPTDARDLLLTVALAGRPISRAAAVEASGLRSIGESLVVSLENHHFLRVRRGARGEQLDTFHDRVREALTSWLEPEQAQALHGRLAEALAAAGADDEVLALHREAAGDRARAAEHAVVAAAAAARSLAFARAAELYLRALELADPPVARRLELLARAAEALGNAAYGRESAATYLEAAQLAPRLEGMEMRRRASEQLLRCGYVPEGVALHEQLQAEIGERAARVNLAGIAGYLWRRLKLYLRGYEYTERSESELGALDLLRLDLMWTASSSFALIVPFEGADFSTRFQLTSLELGEPIRIARAACMDGFQAAVNDLPGSAERLAGVLALARSIAERHDDHHIWGMADGAEAMGCYQTGHMRRALELAERGVARLRTRCVGVVWEIHVIVLVTAWSRVYLGELAELDQQVDQLVKDAAGRGDLLLKCTIEAGLPSIRWLAADDLETMAARRAEITRGLTGDYPMSQLGFHLLTGEVLEMLYRGEGERAWLRLHQGIAPLRKIQFHRIPLVRMELTWMLAAAALHAARTSGPREARRWWARAARLASQLAGDRHPWSGPLALFVRGLTAAARGHRDEAISLLAEAEEELTGAEVILLALAARWRRGELQAGSDGGVLQRDAEVRLRACGAVRPERLAAALTGGGVS
jgi:tetratricopeptide (TPR) repeat protein